MKKRTTIEVSTGLHAHVLGEADSFDLKLKEYSEAALSFFATRKLNPTKYQAGKEFDIVHYMEKAAEALGNQQRQFIVGLGQREASVEKMIEGRERELVSVIEQREKELVKRFDKAVDRIFSYMVTQEKTVLKELGVELVKNRIYSEIILRNLHKLSDISEDELKQLRAENSSYFKDRVDKILVNKAVKL